MRPAATFRFGPFEFDPERGDLRKAGASLKIQPQPARLLLLLVSNPGEIVRREQIQQAVWGNEIAVDYELGVNRCVRVLRSLLLDNSEAPRYIRTIPRQGYSFIAPVEQLPPRSEKAFGGPVPPVKPPLEQVDPTKESGSAAESASPPRTLDTQSSLSSQPLPVPPRQSLHWIAAAAGLIVIILIALLWVRSRPKGSDPVFRIRSLAVMPLQNFSDDHSQDYFADGMTEALITKLSQRSSLRVISRTSIMRYKNTARSLPEIARELDVDGVIEGSVLLSGHKIRITVQLLNAPRDQHIWAESLERNYEDVIRLQDDVSRQIVTEINSTLAATPLRPPSGQTSISPKAYEAYIKGRYLWNQGTPDSVKKSLPYFQEAIAEQPGYALAHSGLAQAYLTEGIFGLLDQRESYDKGSQAASKSLQLDPYLSQPHVSLGERKAGQDWDWAGAEKEYRQAILLEPSNARAHYLLSSLLSILKRHDEAIAEVRRAMQLDPLSSSVGLQAGIAYYFARRMDEAEQTFKSALEMNDASVDLRLWLGRVYLQEKKSALALMEYRRVLNIAKVDPDKNSIWFMPRFAEVYARTGKSEEAEALLKRLQGLSEREQSAPIFALTCVALRRQDEAFRWLKVGLREHHVDMTLLAVEPGYDPIRADTRFRNLLKEMNLPQ